MAVTLVVLAGDTPGGVEASITLDAPRLVLGRSEGCDVRLPEPTVSHRHASIRQRGGEHVLIDENSANGTFLGRVRLPPQTPRVLRSGDRVRLGRVWLEVRFEPAMVKGSTALLAKELALGLVARGLAEQGEDAEARLIVLEGPDAGLSLPLPDPHRTYVIGKGAGSDLPLTDPAAARRHATALRKADTVLVADCGTPGGIFVEGQEVRDATLRPGQTLTLGATTIAFQYPAAEALAELERGPDERMADGDVPEPQRPAAEARGTVETEAEPARAPLAASDEAPASRPRAPGESSGWGAVDSAVIFIALGVLVVSLAGAFWLFGR